MIPLIVEIIVVIEYRDMDTCIYTNNEPHAKGKSV